MPTDAIPPNSNNDLEDNPQAKRMEAYVKQIREISEGLEDVAWTLSMRTLGRAVAGFARHLSEDAQRLETLALMTPAMESLPDQRKSEFQQHFEEFRQLKDVRSKQGPRL